MTVLMHSVLQVMVSRQIIGMCPVSDLFMAFIYKTYGPYINLRYVLPKITDNEISVFADIQCTYIVTTSCRLVKRDLDRSRVLIIDVIICELLFFLMS